MKKPEVRLTTYQQGMMYTTRSGERFFACDPGTPEGDHTTFVFGHMDRGSLWLDDCTRISPEALAEIVHRMNVRKVIDVKAEVVK